MCISYKLALISQQNIHCEGLGGRNLSFFSFFNHLEFVIVVVVGSEQNPSQWTFYLQ